MHKHVVSIRKLGQIHINKISCSNKNSDNSIFFKCFMYIEIKITRLSSFQEI